MHVSYKNGISGPMYIRAQKLKPSNFEIKETSWCGGYYLIVLKSERTSKWVNIGEVQEKGIATAYYDASYTFQPQPAPTIKDHPW